MHSAWPAAVHAGACLACHVPCTAWRAAPAPCTAPVALCARPTVRCAPAAELGGACTFCGAAVALMRGARSEERPPAAERAGAGGGTAAGDDAGSSAASDKAAEAAAFKDRLVGAVAASVAVRRCVRRARMVSGCSRQDLPQVFPML